MWEATSFELDKLQCNVDCVEQEKRAIVEIGRCRERYYDCKLNTTLTSFIQNENPQLVTRETRNNHLVAIVREEGSNGDREMGMAFKAARFRPIDVTMTDLIKDDFSLDKFRGIVFVGFYYADTLGAGNGWATVIENTNIKNKLQRFIQRTDTFSLGVCNGCQLMIELGIFGTGVEIEHNTSGRFESRFSYVEVFDNSDRYNNIENTFFDGMGASKLGIWVAHGEGRFVFNKDNSDIHIPLKYIDVHENVTMKYPYNPNGSMNSAAVISTVLRRWQ